MLWQPVFWGAAIFFLNGLLGGQDVDDPFKSSGPPPIGLSNEEPASTGNDPLDIAIDHQTAVSFGEPGCPVFVVGNDVWDIATGRVVRQLEGEYDPQGRRALSADGKWFVASSKSPNQTQTTIMAWSTATGSIVLEVDGKPDEFADFVTFSRNKYLLLGGRHNNLLDVWDIESGLLMPKKLTVPDRRIEPEGKIVFSPDGKSFASIAHDRLVLTNTATNKRIATMADPGKPGSAPGKGGRSRNPGGYTDESTINAEASFVYAWTSQIQFSPDGQEIAAFTTHPHPRLIIWNTSGQMVSDDPMPLPRVFRHGTTLEWMPDGSSMLLNGYLIDRKTRRTLLSVRTPNASYINPHLLDKNRIAGTLGGSSDRLSAVTIPWEDINESLAALDSKAPALLTPNETVGLEIEAPDEAVRDLVNDVMVRRLARDGLIVGADGKTILRVRISEQAGETLPIYERQSRFDRHGQDTGRRATEVKGAAILEWVYSGQSEPLWRGHLTAESGRSFSEEITDLTIRQSMLEEITRQLNGLDIPWFIPDGSDLLALPAVIE